MWFVKYQHSQNEWGGFINGYLKLGPFNGAVVSTGFKRGRKSSPIASSISPSERSGHKSHIPSNQVCNFTLSVCNNLCFFCVSLSFLVHLLLPEAKLVSTESNEKQYDWYSAAAVSWARPSLDSAELDFVHSASPVSISAPLQLCHPPDTAIYMEINHSFACTPSIKLQHINCPFEIWSN